MSLSQVFQPDWVSSPGETIVDILQEKKLTIKLLAEKIEKSEKYVDELLQGYVEITEDLAEKLNITLGGSKNFWINRDLLYRQELKRLFQKDSEEWLRDLPIKDMINFGWLETAQNKLSACLNFFNVPDIETWYRKYDKLYHQVAFRKSNAFQEEFGATVAWLRQGEILATSIDCASWNPEKFIESLYQIKPLTRKKNPLDFLPMLKEICAKCGVSVAIVRTPKGCRASGATKFLTKDKAMILLSFRYLSDDQFWFTFFHEAGHLVLHANEEIFLEGVSLGPDSDNLEKDANTFAGEILIPYEVQHKLRFLRGKKNIIKFAMDTGISPGIVVGQMQHYGYIDQKYLNGYKRRYDWNDILTS